MAIQTREALVAAVEAGQEFRYLHFWGHQPKADGSIGASCFSQWWVSPFVHEGVVYETAEHWMMAGKARVFGDAAALARVLAEKSPAEAKKIGREVKGFDPVVWDKHKFDLVVEGNWHKFSQHADLKEFLLGTGDQVIVEASPRDSIWGIGMGASNVKANSPREWRGKNLLGFALMVVRERLRA